MDHTKELMASAASAPPADSVPRTKVHEILNPKLPLQDKSLRTVSEEVFTVSGVGFETVTGVLRLVIFHV
jgi:hypothetical protein